VLACLLEQAQETANSAATITASKVLVFILD